LRTITIGCPISNREYLIDRYLEAIYNLDYPKDKIKLYFLINNCQDGTDSTLRRFKSIHDKEYLEIKLEKYKLPAFKDKRLDTYRNETYRRLTLLRNHILENLDTDYFLSVDSDIILVPNTLKKLLKSKKDIIACLINNDSILQPYREYPHIRTNVLINNRYNSISHFYEFPLNSIVECDYTGAVYLISKNAYTKCRYDFHEFGEDIPFCLSAKENGFKLYVDTSLFQDHIMCEYQQYCIDNCCQNPCIRNGNILVYQYKYIDNVVKPNLHLCPKLKKGDEPLLTNDRRYFNEQ